MSHARRARGPLVAAIVLALLVGVSLAVLLARGGGNSPDVAPPPAAPSHAPSSRSPAADAAPLTSAPAGVTWELFRGVALPTSAEDGPTRTDGAVHEGFSRTPTGALLAAVQIGTRSVIEPSLPGLTQIANAQMVDNAGRTSWLNLVAQFTDTTPPTGGYAQIVGFRYLTYSSDVAVISTATRGSNGRLQVGTDTVRWVDGDWKLEKPPSGLQQAQVVQDVAGYVPWSGVS